MTVYVTPYQHRYAVRLREDVLAVLALGRVYGCAKTAAMCRELLAVEESFYQLCPIDPPRL